MTMDGTSRWLYIERMGRNWCTISNALHVIFWHVSTEITQLIWTSMRWRMRLHVYCSCVPKNRAHSPKCTTKIDSNFFISSPLRRMTICYPHMVGRSGRDAWGHQVTASSLRVHAQEVLCGIDWTKEWVRKPPVASNGKLSSTGNYGRSLQTVWTMQSSSMPWPCLNFPKDVTIGRTNGWQAWSAGLIHSHTSSKDVMALISTDHVQVKRQELHSCTPNLLWRSSWKESRTKCYWIMLMASRGISNPKSHSIFRPWHACVWIKVTYVKMNMISKDCNFCTFYIAFFLRLKVKEWFSELRSASPLDPDSYWTAILATSALASSSARTSENDGKTLTSTRATTRTFTILDTIRKKVSQVNFRGDSRCTMGRTDPAQIRQSTSG